jgi:hypothetical protein
VIAIALGKYTGRQRGDLNLLLAGYSWDENPTARIGRGFKDITPCISLFWMGQPSLLRELYASPAVIERGLAGRVLSFIVQHDEIPFDDGEERHIDASLYAAWESCIDQTLEMRDDPRTLSVLPEAKELFTKWHNHSVKLRRGEFWDIEGTLSRWRENAIRIAGVLAVASGAEEITIEIAQDSIRICRWAVLNSLEMLQAGRADRIRQRLRRLQDLLIEGAMTVRDLTKNHGFTKAELERIAEAHPTRFLFETHQPSTGRPSKKMKLA